MNAELDGGQPFDSRKPAIVRNPPRSKYIALGPRAIVALALTYARIGNYTQRRVAGLHSCAFERPQLSARILYPVPTLGAAVNCQVLRRQCGQSINQLTDDRAVDWTSCSFITRTKLLMARRLRMSTPADEVEVNSFIAENTTRLRLSTWG